MVGIFISVNIKTEIMKILVPTDFSEHSDYAFEAAILLAKQYKAEINLFHAANINEEWKRLMGIMNYGENINDSLKDYAIGKMECLVEKARKHDVICHVHYSPDKFLPSIDAMVDKLDIDLVVMGSHGLSHKEEWMIGSNAQKSIRKLKTKVLVLKKPLSDVNLKKVAFVSNLTEEDRHAFQIFLQFLEPYKKTKIHVLYVDTVGWYLKPGIPTVEAFNEFENIANGYDCETYLYNDYAVDAGVRHFIESEGIELVAISNHKRQPLKRFFQGSNVELLVNHSDIPVLSIDYK